MKRKIIIMGAAGRDFHNFNTRFRDNDHYEVIAFTATQIPGIDERKYPPFLAGKLYPDGIPIYPQSDLEELIEKYAIDEVIFSYSDISHEDVMHIASRILAAGPDFRLLGSAYTMIESEKPVIAICAVRTGCGKSQTTRRICVILRKKGKRSAVVRHPMPYGKLAEQAVQRFETIEDLDRHRCTIEEREEYEPHLINGDIVFAGVDYEAILREAEKDADVVIWDGGNNDLSFYRSDLYIVVADPHRAGHELLYHPGETNLQMADIVVINKVDSAAPEDVEEVRMNIIGTNSEAVIIEAASPISVDDPSRIRGKRVLVVEDGPTLTHGEMDYGAGTIAAHKYLAAELVDPEPYAVGSIKETFEKYPEIGLLLPAMGYGKDQIRDLEETIGNTDCDLVVVGTPIDLTKVISIDKPSVRAYYELQEIGKPDLEGVLESFGKRVRLW
jgi:predicted GTPase